MQVAVSVLPSAGLRERLRFIVSSALTVAAMSVAQRIAAIATNVE